MKVFILMGRIDYSGDFIEGVFDNEILAKNLKNELENRKPTPIYDSCDIEIWEVNVGMVEE